MSVVPTPPSGNPVLFVLKGSIGSLNKRLPLAMAGEEEAIHQIRVAARRARVLLPLAALKPGGKRVRRSMRRLQDLGRTAGSSRELGVGLALLVTQTEGRLGPRSAGAALRRRLRSVHKRALGRMKQALLDLDIATLRRDLRRILARGVEDPLTAMLRVRIMREEEGSALLAALASVGGRFDPEALHALRSRARRLRYAAELGVALTGNSPEAVKILKQAQEILGEMHDAWVLGQWLGGQGDAARARDRIQEAAEARRLRAACEALSRSLHAKFLEWKPDTKLRWALALIGRSPSEAGDLLDATHVHPSRDRGTPGDSRHSGRQAPSDAGGGKALSNGRKGPRPHRQPSGRLAHEPVAARAQDC